MKKHILILAFLLTSIYQINAQAFYDDFETYTPGTYLTDSSNVWVTWNNAPGTSEDVLIDDKDAFSGSNSIYFESSFGGGPQDIVLPFGGVRNTGHFRFTSKWKVSSKTGAYFNFQGGASIGSSWTLDVYMYDDGYIDVGGYIYTNYPQDQWFELVVDVDLSNNLWEVFIDGTSLGTFSNWTNNVSYLDIYPLFSAAFWVDDVGYCLDNSCLPDLSLDSFSINPDPICSNASGDVRINVKNHGPDPAEKFILGVSSDNVNYTSREILLNGLAVGKDTSITIPGLFKSNISGSAVPISALNILGDRNITNDTIRNTVEIIASPSGFELVKGSLFEGIDGGVSNPDLIQIGQTNTYEITPPSGYNNSGYATDWEIRSVEIRTEAGDLLPSSAYQLTDPTAGTNGLLSFTADNNYLDSLLTISISISNITTSCDSAATRKLIVVPTPKVNFKFPSSVCVGEDVAFENLSSIHSGFLNFMWYFGDNDSSDMNDPFHQFASAGDYDVRLVAISSPYNIANDTIITITVNEIPNAKFSVKNACLGNAVEFTNLSTINNGTLTYEWMFGDGSPITTTANPTHTFSNFGSYKVTLTAKHNGCESKYTRSAHTFEVPVADFSIPTTPVCANLPIDFTNETTISFGNLGTFWSMGDGFNTTEFSPSHPYSKGGTYTINLLSVSEFDCKDSIKKTITITPSPEPAFKGNQFCSKIPTIFTNNTVEDLPNPIYTWTFSDGTSSTLKNVTKKWPTEGPFKVTLKAEYSNGCSASKSEDFVVLIQPVANFIVQDICSGETASFSNRSKADRDNVKYNWDFGNGQYSTIMSPTQTFTPNTTTTYTVALIASYTGACSDTVRKTLTVSEAPVCDFSFKQNGFLNTSFTPSNTSYSKYEWLFGEGGASTDMNPVYKYTYSGNFYVTMKATNSAGCQCSITKQIGANTSVNGINSNNSISIYPNPNNGLFNISNPNSDVMVVEIFNVLGEKVYSKTSSDNLMNINLNDQSKGIYLVKITVNGVTTTTKITVTS